MKNVIKTISLLGSGWLGFPLAKYLLMKGYQVKTSTRSSNRLGELTSAGVVPFLVDIDSLSESINKFLNSDILIINITSKNIDGFRKLIETINKSAISKVLFVSSTSVYKNNNSTIIESDQIEAADNPLIKIEILLSSNNNFKTTILRFGGLIGCNRHPGNFFTSCRLVPEPDAYVNMIHRDDCIEIITRIIEQDVWGETFNCCADSHPTKRVFYTHAAELAGNAIPNFDDTGENSFKIISNEKVKQVLSYEFIHPDLMKINF